jgi:CxxC-x17-CxxC domain-containing protein
MAYQNDSRPQRQMYDVSSLGLTCAQCGVAITELPFQPTEKEDGTYGRLYCRECNRSRMKDRGPRRDFGGGGRGRY